MNQWESMLAPYMEDFLQYKKAMGYSASSYIWYLGHFDRFCMEYFPKETNLTQEMTLQYLCFQNKSANSLNRRLANIRELARYMQSLGKPAYLLPPKMSAPQTSYLPHIFTEEELSLFFRATDEFPPSIHDPLAQYVVPVMFRILYCCGLRPSEVRLIRTVDFNLVSGRIYIREAKRHKDRAVMLPEDLLHLCDRYDHLRKRHCENDDWFFPQNERQPYGKQWLEYQFRKVWKIAGVTEFVAPKPRVYDFRHTFATRKLYEWMEKKEDLYQRLPYLSAYMGHQTFSSTAYYIHLLPQRLTVGSAIDWQSFANLLPEVSL